MNRQPQPTAPLKTYAVEYVVHEYRKIVLIAANQTEAIAKGKLAQDAGAVFAIDYCDGDDWSASEVRP